MRQEDRRNVARHHLAVAHEAFTSIAAAVAERARREREVTGVAL